MKAKKFREGSDGVSRIEFGSVAEMVENAVNRRSVIQRNQKNYDRYATYKNNFTNHYSLKSIQEALYNPPAASIQIRDMIKQVEGEHEFTSRRRRLVHRREWGDELDEMSWIRRELDGWRRIEKTAADRKVVRIAINLSVASKRKPSELYYRGAAVVALTDAIEAAGHSVEVVAFSSSTSLFSGNDDPTLISVVAKHPEQPVDIDTLSLVCGEIGFYRQAIFAVKATSSKVRICPTLGYPADLPKRDSEQFDIVLECDIFTKEQALKAVNEFAEGFETTMPTRG